MLVIPSECSQTGAAPLDDHGRLCSGRRPRLVREPSRAAVPKRSYVVADQITFRGLYVALPSGKACRAHGGRKHEKTDIGGRLVWCPARQGVSLEAGIAEATIGELTSHKIVRRSTRFEDPPRLASPFEQRYVSGDDSLVPPIKPGTAEQHRIPPPVGNRPTVSVVAPHPVEPSVEARDSER